MITACHISGLICRNVNTDGSFCTSLCLFSVDAWLGVVLLRLLKIQYWQCFFFATHLPSLSPSLCALHCLLVPPSLPSSLPPSLTPASRSLCTCLPRCKQVHAPLIPTPPGPPQCGAVWGNGGHGTRRGFWIQSIQKRPGSFLAEF